eukprot:13450427-Alexandrium_andersonii.AAC.1
MPPGPGAAPLPAGIGSAVGGLSNGAPPAAATGPPLPWYAPVVLATKSLPIPLLKLRRSAWKNL